MVISPVIDKFSAVDRLIRITLNVIFMSMLPSTEGSADITLQLLTTVPTSCSQFNTLVVDGDDVDEWVVTPCLFIIDGV